MCACGLISARTGFQLCCFCYHFLSSSSFFCYCFWHSITTNVTMTKRLASGLRLPSEGLQSIISRTKIRYESALARKSKSNQKKRKLPALWTQVCEGLLRNGLVHMCLQHMLTRCTCAYNTCLHGAYNRGLNLNLLNRLWQLFFSRSLQNVAHYSWVLTENRTNFWLRRSVRMHAMYII